MTSQAARWKEAEDVLFCYMYLCGVALDRDLLHWDALISNNKTNNQQVDFHNDYIQSNIQIKIKSLCR